MRLLFDPGDVNAHVRVHAGYGRGAAADPPRHQADQMRDGIAFAHQRRTAVALHGKNKKRHIIYTETFFTVARRYRARHGDTIRV